MNNLEGQKRPRPASSNSPRPLFTPVDRGRVQHTQLVGNQSVRQTLNNDVEQSPIPSARTASSRFEHDFSNVHIGTSGAAVLHPNFLKNKAENNHEPEANHTAAQVTAVSDHYRPRACSCGGCSNCKTEPRGRTNEPIQNKSLQASGTGNTAAPERPVQTANAPVNEFDDCPVGWQQKANAALVVARKWVTNAVTGLASLPFPFPAPVAELLNRHFHITGRGYVHEVLRHYNTINSALNSPIDFECETKCKPRVAAYVYSIWSDVHLCPVWYGLSQAGQANTIIHEIAHDAANRDDEAYIWEAKYAKLSVEDAIDNADSYSHFAQEAFGE